MPLRLKWWLHACFELEVDGKRLVIDPHDGGSLGVGFSAPSVKADYVLVTHDHYDHNAVEKVSTDHTVVARERTGGFTLGPFKVKGVKLPHDEFDGRIRGFVVAYRIEVEGISLVHLSDLGRMLTEEEVREIGSVDIALIPAGDVYTLHPRQALEAAEALGARIVIPMHYWLPGIQLPLEPLDTILRYAKKWRVLRLESSWIEITREDIPEEKTLAVLAPPR
ncbi:putative Zn-dependent hydrolase [Pyrodictium delaneyi]|uniref:Putative Zn-dependent hydrolase n=1 Tax=Pyrodictium delaneyi TaxID=1273541 RepID=A0A0P0N5B7_9CREN|nr:MBL fold metallo-hydrolase [Pyrodictium delaneyi]ALL01623.1 putative Zn-dependent hydrolase [Pyrodictium delaneyi]OWJ55240.1 hypothetical protein Pdsh_05520 [Pyrodictium delaneyi]